MPFELHTWNWDGCPPFEGYQGLPPLDGRVTCVFLAKDANFPTDEQMNGNEVARNLLSSYIINPGAFFENNPGIHHPFRHGLWPIATHSGGRFHSRLAGILAMATMENNAISAANISILEMLRMPTTGNSRRCALFKQAVAAQIPNPNVQTDHLRMINAVLNNPNKRVFVFKGFLGLWNSFSVAHRDVLEAHAPLLGSLATWLAIPDDDRDAIPCPIAACIHPHTHLSNAITNLELGAMANVIAGLG